MSVADHEIDEPEERRRYCQLHDCTYGWGCPQCRDDAADRDLQDRVDAEDAMDNRYFDRQGQPVSDTLRWAKLFEDRSYQRVALTILTNGIKVSTVWLGLNHQWGDGPPLIFETMVFPDTADFHEDDCARYSSEAEAVAGHQGMCEKWEKASTHG